MLAQEEAGRGRGRGRQPPEPVEEEDDGDIDDDDLIASTAGMDSPTGASSQHTGAASNRWSTLLASSHHDRCGCLSYASGGPPFLLRVIMIVVAAWFTPRCHGMLKLAERCVGRLARQVGRTAAADSICERGSGHAQSNDWVRMLYGAPGAACPEEEMLDQATPLRCLASPPDKAESQQGRCPCHVRLVLTMCTPGDACWS